jgi:dTDP-D-glucose 4,6-dehydratase
MKNILVTGGSGFIGSNFIHYLIEKYKDLNIVNVDKLTYAGNPENLLKYENNTNYSFVRADICDLTKMIEIFKDHNIDTVVNFAAESHVDRSILGPEEFIRTNIYGTFSLLEACRKTWKDYLMKSMEVLEIQGFLLKIQNTILQVHIQLPKHHLITLSLLITELLEFRSI